jgi:hypothetical protein
MLIKSRQFIETSDPRLKAGQDAEKQMAFLLDRRFADQDDVFLLHDLRIEHGAHAFQIDHLVVTRYGLALVESKSIHGKVSITRHDENREHWTREFRGRQEGMPSPVLQVQEQARLLQDFLSTHREKILGKALFVLQKGFRYCPFDVYVGVSTSAVFELSQGTSLPKDVYKADELPPQIASKLAGRHKQHTSLLNLDTLWSMSRDEAHQVARFLLDHHSPLQRPEAAQPAPASLAPVVAPTPAPAAVPAPAPSLSLTLKAGDPCPECGKHELRLAAGPVKADGSRARYLACLGNQDKSCRWKILYTTPAPAPEKLIHSTAPAVAEPEPVYQAAEPAEGGAEPSADGSAKSYYCYSCKADIPTEVARFCWDRRDRFGGKAYCRRCQHDFPYKRAARARAGAEH